MPDALASTPNEFGVALKDSWFITPCYQELTFNCLTVSSALRPSSIGCTWTASAIGPIGAVSGGV